jgi:hypothetical protein
VCGGDGACDGGFLVFVVYAFAWRVSAHGFMYCDSSSSAVPLVACWEAEDNYMPAFGVEHARKKETMGSEEELLTGKAINC